MFFIKVLLKFCQCNGFINVLFKCFSKQWFDKRTHINFQLLFRYIKNLIRTSKLKFSSVVCYIKVPFKAGLTVVRLYRFIRNLKQLNSEKKELKHIYKESKKISLGP